MAIQRSGTPTTTSGSGTTLSVTIPSDAAVGALCFISAGKAATGAWGATPSGWSVYPNTTQTASNLAAITYYKVLQSGDPGSAVTINIGSGVTANAICYAYTGATLDLGGSSSGVQFNASSSTGTSPSVTPTGPADFLVMAYVVHAIATINAGSQSEGSIWTSGKGAGVVDLQLNSNAATGAQTVTWSSASTNDGTQILLAQLDADAQMAGPYQAIRSAMPMQGFNRAARAMNPGLDEEITAAVGDDPFTLIMPRRMLAFRLPAMPAFEETAFVAPVTDEPWTPPMPRIRGLRARPQASEEPLIIAAADENLTTISPSLGRKAGRLRVTQAGRDDQAFVAPVTDADIAQPRVRPFQRFRLSTTGDEQQALVSALQDASTVPPPRLRGFRTRNQAADEPLVITDDAASGIPRLFKRLRGGSPAADGLVPTAAAEDNPSPIPHSLGTKTGRMFGLPSFFGRALRATSDGGEPIVSAMPDEASVAPACPWRYFRRWVRQVGEDLGIIAPPAAPSFHFGATLDVAIIFAATCDLAKVLNAVLNAPLIFGATLG